MSEPEKDDLMADLSALNEADDTTAAQAVLESRTRRIWADGFDGQPVSESDAEYFTRLLEDERKRPR